MLAAVAWEDPLKVAMLMGILLAAAAVGVRLARITRVPRVVGYLVMGVIFRLIFQWASEHPNTVISPLGNTIELVNTIKSLGLCLIMFAIGSTFDAAHLKAIRGHIWKLTLAEVTIVFAAVFLGTWVISEEHSSIKAVFLAIAAIATAPAATLLVLRQYGAKGPTTDHILAMTGLNNLIAIVLFYIAFLVFAEIGPAAGGIHAEHMDHGLVLGIVYASIGSAIIGCLLGLSLSLANISLTRFESLLIYFGLMLAVSVGAKILGLNHLIICLFMGLTYINFSIQPHQLLEELEPISAPIFALFFVLAGFNIELQRLWEVGAIGIAFIAMRTMGKIFGAYLGIRWIGSRHLVPKQIGIAMLCQAGVAIGLGKYLVEHWGKTVDGAFEPDPVALGINTIILASVVIFELAGPLATKRAVVRAGEVKALTLLARPTGSAREMGTVTTRLRRAISPRKKSKKKPEEQELTAIYVMRTNVATLRESAKMAEVLKFVEHSKLNHFFVVDAEGNLVGTVDFSDLRNLMYNPVMAQFLTAYDMANTAPPVVYADRSLKDILDLFHKHDVGSLPVIEGPQSRRFLGVVEQRDVLQALHADESDSGEESGH
ncbi:MAG: cation:proton antiporter domain-containing protein [Planctomycetota bacterium]|jgi:Kef-type K+ transport system membrane component KefB/CBS domain-containing protein